MKSLFRQTSDATKSSCKNPQTCLYYKLLQDTKWVIIRQAPSTYEFEIPPSDGRERSGEGEKHEAQTEVWKNPPPTTSQNNGAIQFAFRSNKHNSSAKLDLINTTHCKVTCHDMTSGSSKHNTSAKSHQVQVK